MSALGQKQTFKRLRLMSALPPKVDIGTQSWNVRFAKSGAGLIAQRSRRLGRYCVLFFECTLGKT